MLKSTLIVLSLLRRPPLHVTCAKATSTVSASSLPEVAAKDGSVEKGEVNTLTSSLITSRSSLSFPSYAMCLRRATSSLALRPPSPLLSLHRRVPATPPKDAATFLQHAIASREANTIVAALASTLARSPSVMDDLIRQPTTSMESITTLLSACVAVYLAEHAPGPSPTLYSLPPWVACRVQAGSLSQGKRARPLAKRGAHETEQKPSHAAEVAFSLFHTLARKLHRARNTRDATSPNREGRTYHANFTDDVAATAAVQAFAGLCAITMAPNDAAVQTLSRWWLQSDTVEEDTRRWALGCALANYCQKHTTNANGGGEAAAERAWLSLWASLPTHLPSGDREVVERAEATGLSSHNEYFRALVDVRTVRQQCFGWHLHCLLRARATEEETDTLQTTLSSLLSSETHSAVATAGATLERPHAAPPSLPETLLAELLSAVSPADNGARHGAFAIAAPSPAAAAADCQVPTGLYRQLSDMLMQHTRRAVALHQPALPQLFYRGRVPAVTTNATLFARMIDYVVQGLCAAPSTSWYADRLTDLHLLFSVANVDALAASLVPADRPLPEVMAAATSEERKRKMRTLAEAMGRAVEHLTAGIARATNDALHAPEKKRAEAALGQGVATLSALLALCASRESSLPARKAEPRWRRELRAATAVRTHKYQLLLTELPHAVLSQVLHQLLASGHLGQGSTFGGCLVRERLVDLRFYSLYVLGSLYQAIAATESPTEANTSSTAGSSSDRGVNAAASVMQSLRALYRRREEVFGEQLLLAPAVASDEQPHKSNPQLRARQTGQPSLPSSPLPRAVARNDVNAVAVTRATLPVRIPEPAALPSLHEAIQRMDSDGGAALDVIRLTHCLVNRTVVEPGGRLVVDSQRHPFDTWVMKGTVRVQV